MVVSVSSADKDAEKTFDSFNRMHITWRDGVRDREQREVRADHIHLVQKIQQENIAISECCRGQNTSIYISI